MHNIPKPSLLPYRWSYYIFKGSIQPAWEDPYNRGGGSITFSLQSLSENKDTVFAIHSEAIFFDLVLFVIGNDLPEASNINGIIFSKIKNSIDIWVNTTCDTQVLEDALHKNLNIVLRERKLPELARNFITYKKH